MKKIGILLAILLVAGVCATADEVISVQTDLLFADIDAVVLSSVEMEAVDGGYDPDAGGNNYRITRSDIEKVGKYLSQESSAKVSVSLQPEWNSPGVSGGYDVYPDVGPYLRLRAGPISIKLKLGRK